MNNSAENSSNNKPSSKVWLVVSVLFLVAGAIWGIKLFRQQQSVIHNTLPSKTIPIVKNSSHVVPVSISIPALGINTSIVNLFVDDAGTLEVPTNPSDVGWYEGSKVPGEDGPTVMVGHLDSVSGAAIFWNLRKLKSGDKIQITRSDGSKAIFTMQSKENFSQNNFPTKLVYGGNEPSLRLITCSGTYSHKAGHYSQNLVVFAKLDFVLN
jgi:LPXTG-site transpeptidase (sortase) family protein